MQQPTELRIRQSHDPDEFEYCSLMMSGADPWLRLGMDRPACRRAFEGPCKEVHVAMAGERIAGFAIIQTCGTFSGYIQTLCVAREFRSKGIGSSILRYCESLIGVYSPNVFICVSAFNTDAMRLYERFGFRVVGELPDLVKKGFTEILMRKTGGPILQDQPRSQT